MDKIETEREKETEKSVLPAWHDDFTDISPL